MKSNIILLLLIVLFGGLSQFASDIYTPALPTIATSLHAHINLVQWSMALYMFGVAVSMLFYGPISEGVGRKLPLLVGLTIALIGTLICWFAPNIEVLIIGRLVQGLGAGAGACIWRAIFRDTFSGEVMAKYSSYLSMLLILIIPAAPVLGAYLEKYISWRAIFGFLTIYIIVASILTIILLRESSQQHHSDKLKITYILATTKRLLTSRVFMGTTACVFFSYGAFFAWFTAGPVILIKYAGISSTTYGWLTFTIAAVAYLLGGKINSLLITRFSMPILMRAGWSMMIIAGVIMLLCKFLFALNAWIIFIPVGIFYFGSTFIWPNAFATAFKPHGDIAGYAGTFYSFMQITGAAVLSGLIAHLPTVDQLPLALVFITASTLAWLLFEIIAND